MSKPAILVWDQAYNRNGDPKLARTVVNVIRTYMDNHTLTGFVKAETLAEATGLTIRAVRKQIAANVAAGWLEIVEKGHSGRKANVYRLTDPKGESQFTIGTGKAFKGGTTVHPEGEPQFTPTSPRTSPKRSSSPTEGEPKFTLPGTGLKGPGRGIDLSPIPTTESKGEPEFTIAKEQQFLVPPVEGDPNDPFSDAFVPRTA